MFIDALRFALAGLLFLETPVVITLGVCALWERIDRKAGRIK